jgi:hypothetical protein
VSPVKRYEVGQIRKLAAPAPPSDPKAVEAQRKEQEWVRGKWQQMEQSLGESK